MLSRVLITFFILLAWQTESRDTFYISKSSPTSFYQCYKQSGYNRIILLISSISKGINKDCIENIMNAKNAGVIVEGLLGACRARRSPEEELSLVMKIFGPDVFDRLWLYPETISDAICFWKSYSA